MISMYTNYKNKTMYPKPTREEVGKKFLDYCNKVGFGHIDLEIADGLPYMVERGVQRVRFDLSENKGDATFDLDNHEQKK